MENPPSNPPPSYADQVLESLQYGDLFGALNTTINTVAGDTYAQADSIASLNDLFLQQIGAVIDSVDDLARNQGLLSRAAAFQILGPVHDAASLIQKTDRAYNNLQTAQNAGELTGGLASIATTSGQIGLLLGAAANALALAAVAFPAAAPVLLTVSVSLNGLANTVNAIQSGLGDVSTLVTAIDNAIQQANLPDGGPVVIPAQVAPDGTQISPPITINPGDEIVDITIPPDRRPSLVEVVGPPPGGELNTPPAPNVGPGATNSGGGGGGLSAGPSGLGDGRPSSGLFKPDQNLLDWVREQARQREEKRKKENEDNNAPGPTSGSGPDKKDIKERDPFVLDLDGDGIELTAIEMPPVFFDYDGDGVGTLTGWVDPDDGLLGRDLDGNGLIETQVELFGTRDVDAISDLATEDSNFDGFIDANDNIWDTLRVWRDLNQDGLSTANEVVSMEAAEIVSISLDAQIANEVVQDNLIYSNTTYETASGEVRDASAVFFGVGFFNTRTLNTPDFGPDSPFFGIPNVKGFGGLKDLRVAAFDDPALTSLAQQLVDDLFTLDGFEIIERFEALALHWAGVQDIPSNALPFDLDPQQEAFLQVVTGVPTPEGLNDQQVAARKDYYASYIDSLALRFAVDATQRLLLDVAASEGVGAVADNPLLPLAFIELNPQTGIISTIPERVFYEIGTRLPASPSDAFERLEKILPLLSAFEAELYDEDLDFTLTIEEFDGIALSNLLEYISNPTIANYAFSLVNKGETTNGTAGNDTLAHDLTPFENVSARSHIVALGTGDDSFDAGVVTVIGQQARLATAPWDFTYVYRLGDGQDVIDVTGALGRHKVFLPDIDIDLVELSTAPNGLDAVLRFSDGGKITFVNFFAEVVEEARERALTVFTADGTILEPDGAPSGGVLISTPADEILTGDTARSDSYFYEIGGGADQIVEGFLIDNTVFQDTLFLTDINRADVITTVEGDDVVLTFANGEPGDSVRIVDQLAQVSFFSHLPSTRIENIQFADAFIDAQTLIDDMLAAQATDGDDSIDGLKYDDLLFLSSGADLLRGLNGGDLYVRPADVVGDTVIDDSGLLGSALIGSLGDVLVIQGFSRDAATFSRDGTNVVITLPNGTVTLANQAVANSIDLIELVIFDDGAMAPADIALALAPITGDFTPVTGDDTNQTLNGTTADEIFNGGGGIDTLNGRQGNDIYEFGAASGDVTISELGDASNVSADRVVFLDHTPEDLVISRVGNNVEIEVRETGQTLTLTSQLSSGAFAIEEFLFPNGEIWTAPTLADNAAVRGSEAGERLNGTRNGDLIVGGAGADELFGGAGPDTYEFRPGDGLDLIVDSTTGEPGQNNTLRLPETGFDDLRIEVAGATLRDIVLRYGPDDAVTLQSANTPDEFAISRPIQRVELGDGTVLTDADLRNFAVLFGTDEDDTVTGSGRIDGGPGDDLLVAHGGEAVFLWSPGAGNDRTESAGFDGGAGRVEVQNLASSGVSFTRDGLNLVITQLVTGETLTILDQFQSVQNGLKDGVNTVAFQDDVLDRDDLAQLSLTQVTAGAETLLGGADDEIFEGLEGDDVNSGGRGEDVYFWSQGDGNDTFIEADPSFDEIDVVYLRDVDTFDDVTLGRRDGVSDDLEIRITATGEVLTFENQLRPFGGGFEALFFADGSVLDVQNLGPFVPFEGTPGDDLIEGDFTGNILIGGVGDDTLNGLQGADTYSWSLGDGNDLIAETEFVLVSGEDSFEEGELVERPITGAGDVLRLENVLSADASFAISGSDLLVTMTATGETVTIAHQFEAPLTGIERIIFADEVLTRADIFGAVGGSTLVGDGSNQSLVGGFGPDTFLLGSGDENIMLGGGPDLLIVGENSGRDVVEDVQRGPGGTQIQLPNGVFATFDDLIAAATQTANGVVLDLGDDNTLALTGLVLTDLTPRMFGFAAPAIEGTEEDDLLLGTLFDDVILGLGGRDIFQSGTGDDTLYGGEGEDIALFSGVAGDYSVVTTGSTTVVTDQNLSNGDEGTNTLTGIEVLTFLEDGTSDFLDDGPSSTFETEELADGVIRVTELINGQPVARTTTDPLNARVWNEIAEDIDENGFVSNRTFKYDDGRIRDAALENGIRQSVSEVDPEDVRPWTNYDVTFDEKGTQLQRVIVFDDGRVKTLDYLDGVRSSAVVMDDQNAKNWTEQRSVFDTTGQILTRTTDFDDGRVKVVNFLDGMRTSAVVTDPADTQTWTEQSIAYDATGTIEERIIFFDDGRIKSVLFDNGIRSEITITDPMNTKPWEIQFTSFDESGTIQSRATEFDDGRVITIDFVDGIRSRSVTNDPLDAKSWTEQVDTFDFNGDVLNRFIVFDTGIERSVAFVNGVRSSATSTDVDDVKPWSSYSDTFDEDGTLVSRVFTYDDWM